MQLVRSFFLSAVILAPAAAGAQSLLERPPNVSGNWTGSPGTLYFHFIHRFSTSDAPERKVSNVPTFLVAAGLPKRILAGFNYSTNSTLAPSFPNEWELFARWAPLSQDYGAPFDLGGQVGYNNAADGVDGELSVARKLGITRVILAGRALADPLESGKVRYAIAGGAAIRLGTFLSLAGDVASLTGRDSAERVAWSAGLHLAIPLTPHTFSLQATNAPVATLQGNSKGTGNVRYGFEFTIPLTLRRYFGGRSEPSPTGDTVATADPAAPSDAVPTTTVVADSAVPLPAARPPGRVVAPTPPVARSDTVTPRAPTPAPRTTTPARTPPPQTPPPQTPPPRTTTVPPSSPGGTAKPAPSRPPVARPAARVRTGMKNINYLQPRLQVTVGTTIEWTNSDPLPHTVTATDKSFDSGPIAPGKTFRHTFTKAGTFNFFCVPHPFMKGTVVVKAQ